MIVNFRFKNYVALTDVPGIIFIFSKLRHVLWSERKFGDWLIIEYGLDSGSSVWYQPPSFLSRGSSLRPHSGSHRQGQKEHGRGRLSAGAAGIWPCP